jgi:hypothetical protein
MMITGAMLKMALGLDEVPDFMCIWSFDRFTRPQYIKGLRMR